LLRVIRRPRDHLAATIVYTRDQICIDERGLLPEVFGAGGGERRPGIEMARDFEYASTYCGEQSLYRVDDAVVEGMNDASGVRLTNAAHHECLHIGGLYFDVDRRGISHGLQDFLQRRYENVVSERKSSQVACSEVRDCGFLARWHATGIQQGIMMNHYLAVACGVYIELYRVGADFQSTEKSRQRILWQDVVGAAVGNAGWN
jgi:hypothetical protein